MRGYRILYDSAKPKNFKSLYTGIGLCPPTGIDNVDWVAEVGYGFPEHLQCSLGAGYCL